MPALRSDIVLIDKAKRIATMIEVAVHLDWEVKDREDMKILKYQEFSKEILKLWNTNVKDMPIIVGSHGATSSNFDKHLREITGKHSSTALMKSPLLGSSNILCHVLDL